MNQITTAVVEPIDHDCRRIINQACHICDERQKYFQRSRERWANFLGRIEVKRRHIPDLRVIAAAAGHIPEDPKT
jgi:hypothetical protein